MKKFLKNEVGAVTVDWIALTAAILLLGMIVIYSVFNNSADSMTDLFNTVDEEFTGIADSNTQNVPNFNQ